MRIYAVTSTDGGLTGAPAVVTEHPEAHLCEAGALMSPDGKEMALLLRKTAGSLTHSSASAKTTARRGLSPESFPEPLLETVMWLDTCPMVASLLYPGYHPC